MIVAHHDSQRGAEGPTYDPRAETATARGFLKGQPDMSASIFSAGWCSSRRGSCPAPSRLSSSHSSHSLGKAPDSLPLSKSSVSKLHEKLLAASTNRGSRSRPPDLRRAIQCRRTPELWQPRLAGPRETGSLPCAHRQMRHL